jgi:predicted CxxxxCH...CXXCH cytochrome family protein
MLAASLTGCGDPNDASLIDPETGAHAAKWLPEDHRRAASSDLAACADCHGSDLLGGISNVSCTSCHLGGVTNIHPAGWLGDACSNHGSYALTNGTGGCATTYCHGTSLGGVPQSGPSCTSCHPTIPTSSRCGTCHGIPPAGTAYPDTAGKHAAHLALNGVTCTTCHDRSCDQHLNDSVEVQFDAAYNARSAAASFTTSSASKTCSGVSCHGGPRTQTLAQMQQAPPQSAAAQTPDWYTGSISVGSQCSMCHIYGTAEYNSYSSGRHYKHLGGDGVIYAGCLDCHDAIKLSNASFHFANLNTPVTSAGTASASINSWLNYNGITCTYAACHSGETRPWW